MGEEYSQAIETFSVIRGGPFQRSVELQRHERGEEQMMTLARCLLALCLLVAYNTPARAAGGADGQQPQTTPSEHPVKVTIYPILIQAPIFGASIDLPSIPSGGGGGGGGAGEGGAQSGSTDLGLNSAYMFGASVEARRWFVEFSGLWASLSASRTTPRVNVDASTRGSSARGGIRVFDGVSATVGFRRIGVDLDATLDLPILGKTIEGKANASLWDPLIGVDWRSNLGRRWSVDADFQGGGFGVGADVDLSGEVNANWHIAKHADLRFGMSVLHYKYSVANVNIGSFQRTLISAQTLYGPLVGFGVVF
jgi:hypothetical protein